MSPLKKLNKKNGFVLDESLQAFPTNGINRVERGLEDLLHSEKPPEESREMLLTAKSDVKVPGYNISDSTTEWIK